MGISRERSLLPFDDFCTAAISRTNGECWPLRPVGQFELLSCQCRKQPCHPESCDDDAASPGLTEIRKAGPLDLGGWLPTSSLRTLPDTEAVSPSARIDGSFPGVDSESFSTAASALLQSLPCRILFVDRRGASARVIFAGALRRSRHRDATASAVAALRASA